MTSQLISVQPLSQTTTSENSMESSVCSSNSVDARMQQAIKSMYQTNHQEEFFHLQAQVESLLESLQALKQDRQLASSP